MVFYFVCRFGVCEHDFDVIRVLQSLWETIKLCSEKLAFNYYRRDFMG